MFPPKKKSDDKDRGRRDDPNFAHEDGKGKPNPFAKKDGKEGKPNPFEQKSKPGDHDSESDDGDGGKPGEKPDASEGGDTDWEDGAPFDPKLFAQEHGSAGKRAQGDPAGGFGGKPHAMDEDGDGQHDGDAAAFDESDDVDGAGAGAAGPNGKAKPKPMHVEPHESGAGHKVHFHEDVHADLPADGDYQHHVMEHAKHYAGYLTHKDADPEKAEAHRQAANLHSRVGNALHAGGDTAPRRAESGAGGGMAPPGAPAGLGQPQVGPDGERLADPDGGFGQLGGEEQSPGEDAVGGQVPAVPDQKRNLPGRDSIIEADRSRSGKKFPPLPLMGKSGVFFRASDLMKSGGPYIGPKGGKWADPQHTIPYDDKSEKKPAATWKPIEGGHEHSSGAKLIRTTTKRGRPVWSVHHKGQVHELPRKASFDHAEAVIHAIETVPGQTRQLAKPLSAKPKAGEVSAKDVRALNAAHRHGVVPGGMDATFAHAYRLEKRGLLERSKQNAGVLVPTEAGRKALGIKEPVKKSIKLTLLPKALFDYTW